MSRCIIIYKSKTGFTKQYAEWLQDSLKCKITSYEQRNLVDLSEFQTIIYCGAFYAGKINGISWFKRQLPKLTGKRAAVLAVGATPARSPEIQENLRKNFSKEEWKKIRAFYVQGGLNYEKMNFVDRMIMSLLRNSLKKTEPNSEKYRTLSKSFNGTDRTCLLGITSYCLKKKEG